MTVSFNDRKVGVNLSIKFKDIPKIDEKAKSLGVNRSSYIWSLIMKDLNLDERE